MFAVELEMAISDLKNVVVSRKVSQAIEKPVLSTLDLRIWLRTLCSWLSCSSVTLTNRC